MDHKYINEFDIIDRYLMGRLPAEEITEFESHFVDCRGCIGQMKTTTALVDGLRIVASKPVAEPPGYNPRGMFSGFPHTSSRKPLALAAVALLVVALFGAVVAFNQIRRLQREAAQAVISSAEWERRYEEERESSSLADMKHQESERDLQTQLAELRAELENKQNPQATPDGAGTSTQPQINLAIFVLKSTRASDQSPGAVNELLLPGSPANFVISVPLEEQGGYKTYRTTIENDRRDLIWKGRALKPDRYNSLSVGFKSTFFRVGDYLLTVKGVAADGRTSVVGKYPFRVLKNP